MQSSISYWTLRNKYSPPLQRCRTADAVTSEGVTPHEDAKPTVPPAALTHHDADTRKRDGL